jgi:hypothetical protein
VIIRIVCILDHVHRARVLCKEIPTNVFGERVSTWGPQGEGVRGFKKMVKKVSDRKIAPSEPYGTHGLDIQTPLTPLPAEPWLLTVAIHCRRRAGVFDQDGAASAVLNADAVSFAPIATTTPAVMIADIVVQVDDLQIRSSAIAGTTNIAKFAKECQQI